MQDSSTLASGTGARREGAESDWPSVLHLWSDSRMGGKTTGGGVHRGGGEKAGANVVHLTSNQRLKEIKDQSEQFGNFNS